MTLAPGKLVEVLKCHYAITDAAQVISLITGELMLVVRADNTWQGVALRLETGELVHISSLDIFTGTSAYVEAAF